MNDRPNRITMTGAVVSLALVGSGCRSHTLRSCEECSPCFVSSIPALTSARAVQPMKRDTTTTSRSPFTLEEVTTEIYNMRADINRLRDDVDQLKSRVPEKGSEKPLG
jgi:hypothetical protein